ncbi:ABC transporter permease [Ornithinimicrobium humiphilum]|uniref:D-methionine transport system permease protein n=1 Tax=Ornithinimicrobium humiphilum TaxID=125288 RepID=A0A543KRH9_9MICO|nr:methionine ABC transporter permease [Ornithinimicrobium humiphilum]TQM97664.1 D-methionine transport system permease protein [Ornithinimicrobium humiphilum]
MIDWDRIGPALWQATVETGYMVSVSMVLAVVLGIPLGVLLLLTAPDGLRPQRLLNAVLGAVVNVGRSVPFIVLLVLVAPVTRLVTGTTIGSTATIVPLTIAAVPFFARLVEASLREVHPGKIEAARAMGASTRQIVRTVLLPEARPGLVAAATVTVVALISYSAMAGAIGGGGLGDFAIRYGYQRFDTAVTVACVVVLLVVVQVLQSAGDRLARRLAHR